MKYKIFHLDKPDHEVQLTVGESLLVVAPQSERYQVQQIRRARDPINTEFLDRFGVESAFSTGYEPQADERIITQFCAKLKGTGRLLIKTPAGESIVVTITVV